MAGADMLIRGDARYLPLEDESVQMCCTSPPYWGLRRYDGLGDDQVGLEATPEKYVSQMVEIFREVHRVLHPSGTLWLNIGDCYHNGDKGGYAKDRVKAMDSMQASNLGTYFVGAPNRMPHPGLKPKDLVGIPWMLAFALRDDGWWLRSEITWCKSNGMPSSVTDRPSCATEKLFLLSKSERYFYDHLAVKMPPADVSVSRWNQYLEGQRGSARANAGDKTNGPMKAVGGPSRKDKQRGHSRRHAGFNDRWDGMTKEEQMEGGANLKNWWVIATARSSDPHYAVMPEDMARICILAGSRPGDVVLDPFGGSGTTAKVALELGRKPIHIDLTYHELARKRMTTTPAMAGLM